jgi:hypothetical protein
MTIAGETLDKGAGHIAVAAAVQTREARAFTDWARLPFYRMEHTATGTAVRITDARYGANVLVPVDSLPQDTFRP